MKFSFVSLIAVCFVSASAVLAEEPMLPQSLGPVGGYHPADGPRGFLKPTKSIKPPASTSAPVPAPTIAQTPAADTRLRRLVVVSGTMTPEAIRDTILACGQTRMPVTTAGGVSAPAPMLSDLAGLFGSTVDEDTKNKVLETVRKGMGSGAKPLKRVEVVGWLPSEGVMAVAVYPES